ncbi:MAG: hypothetical protein E4G96_00040 [Chrysiogenales bacterium]|nr:MAG: hypothetical protein E4G96_00040 [Chrysiogenales bacterium]
MKYPRTLVAHHRSSCKPGSICITVLVIAMVFAGCVKDPDKLITPILSIEPALKDNRQVYTLSLSAGLQNENSDVAFLDMKGNIVFIDPMKSNSRVLIVPFALPLILPFDTGIIEVEKSYTDEEIMPLVLLMGSDREKLLNERSMERTFIDKKKIGLELTGYHKKSILDLLKDKLNEKN